MCVMRMFVRTGVVYFVICLGRGGSFDQSEVRAADCQVQKLPAPDGARADDFGGSVFVSSGLGIVGAHRDDCADGVNCGAAYVYRFNGSNWVEEQKLTASDAGELKFFGDSVSIDGERALVGASGESCVAGLLCGAAYVFRFNGSNWVEEQKLTASDAGQFDDFGFSVSISAELALIGAPLSSPAEDSHAGSAYVFRNNGSAWVEEKKLLPADPAAEDFFGTFVRVRGDVAVVGAPNADCAGGSDCGAAYVFRYNGKTWIEEQKLTASDAEDGDAFGNRVSLVEDLLVVGAPFDDCGTDLFHQSCGAAYVFRFNGSNWDQEQKLTASDAAGNDAFGNSVSLARDMLVLGAPFDNCGLGLFPSDCGSAYVFRFNESTWVEQRKLKAFDAAEGDFFGASISIAGDAAVFVGAPDDDCETTFDCGAVYVLQIGVDCNGNLRQDESDIAEGISLDLNGDGIPDECSCPGLVGDSNDDGRSDLRDVADYLNCFGRARDAHCRCVDMDSNGWICLPDLWSFLDALTGP